MNSRSSEIAISPDQTFRDIVSRECPGRVFWADEAPDIPDGCEVALYSVQWVDEFTHKHPVGLPGPHNHGAHLG
jgi:hypothetical protein